ncbi:MAG: hypothetical protein J6R42_03830 [Clostridia bacterium]|nr:hypothetical protein [Clostridia bacterium]
MARKQTAMSVSVIIISVIAFAALVWTVIFLSLSVFTKPPPPTNDVGANLGHAIALVITLLLGLIGAAVTWFFGILGSILSFVLHRRLRRNLTEANPLVEGETAPLPHSPTPPRKMLLTSKILFWSDLSFFVISIVYTAIAFIIHQA